MALGPVSFGGLASGLDIKSIITAIMNAERHPVTLLEQRQSAIDSKKQALSDFSSKLGSLRTMLQDLASRDKLGARKTETSDETILAATAGTSADLGIHEIEVTALARAHKVRSATVASRFDPVVSDGTITIRSGSRAPVTVNVSAASGNNSLAAIRDQINAADGGVTASIVNDGSGDLLVLRSRDTGTANALTITDTTNLSLASGANVLATAADAHAVVDGVAVTSSSNTLTTAIQGVSIDLLQARPGTTVSVTVAADTDAVRASVRQFVDAYNTVARALHDQFSADPQTGKAGVLAGDALLRRAQDLLQSSISSGVAGLPTTGLTTLGAIGISIEGSSGNLALDETKLQTALGERFDQVASLFAAAGRASDPAVVFGSVSSQTAQGTYAVQVTTAPERATILASEAVGASGLSAGETLTITVGSASAQVALTSGDSLEAIVGKINGALASAGVGARASADAGKLRLTSTGYGSAASLSVVSDLASAPAGTTGIGTTPLADAGVDVVGTLNGEAATGVGNTLTAAGTSLVGLTVSIFTDAAGVAAHQGSFGTITVTRGVADTLARDLKSVVDPIGGLFASAISGFDDESRHITDQIAGLEARLTEREAFLVRQFDAAERAIQALQQQQSALGQSYSLF